MSPEPSFCHQSMGGRLLLTHCGVETSAKRLLMALMSVPAFRSSSQADPVTARGPAPGLVAVAAAAPPPPQEP